VMKSQSRRILIMVDDSADWPAGVPGPARNLPFARDGFWPIANRWPVKLSERRRVGCVVRREPACHQWSASQRATRR
jgi:hypothetical protein